MVLRHRQSPTLFYNEELALALGQTKYVERRRKDQANKKTSDVEKTSDVVHLYGNSFSTSPINLFFMLLALCMYCTFIYMVIKCSLFLPGTPFLQYVILMTWLVAQSIIVYNFFRWSVAEKFSVFLVFVLYFAIIMACLPTTQDHRESTLTQGMEVGLTLIKELWKNGASSLDCHADLKAILDHDCLNHEDRCKALISRAENTTTIYSHAISTTLEKVPGERKAGIMGFPHYLVNQVKGDTGTIPLADYLMQLPYLENESIVPLSSTLNIPPSMLDIATVISVEKTSIARSSKYAVTLYGLNAMKQFGQNMQKLMILGHLGRMLPDRGMGEMIRDTTDTLIACFYAVDQGLQFLVHIYLPSENEYPVVAVDLCRLAYCTENKIYYTWNNYQSIPDIMKLQSTEAHVTIGDGNTFMQNLKSTKKEVDSAISDLVVEFFVVINGFTGMDEQSSVSVLGCHSVRDENIFYEATVVNPKVLQNSVKKYSDDAETVSSGQTHSNWFPFFFVDTAAFELDVVEPQVAHANVTEINADVNQTFAEQNHTHWGEKSKNRVVCLDQNVSSEPVSNSTRRNVKTSVEIVSCFVFAAVFIAGVTASLILLNEFINFIAYCWVKLMEFKNTVQEPLSKLYEDYETWIHIFIHVCIFGLVVYYFLHIL